MKHGAINTKKLLAASGLAFGLAGFGLFASTGTAVADGTLPDTGSYDELLGIVDDDATQGDFDADATQSDFDDDGLQADRVTSSVAHTPQPVT